MNDRPASTFVPWSVPSAAALAVGIAAEAAGMPVPMLAAAALVLAVGALAFARRNARRVPWTLLLVALLLPLGALRHAQRSAWHDPLAPLAGRTVVLSGTSDGRFLHVDGVRSVVAMRPSSAVPRGEVRVRGRLVEAEGARNPGGFDERAWLARRGGSLLLLHPFVEASDGDARTLRGRMRQGLEARVQPDVALLLRALVLGEREDARELRASFADAGLAHLLALSGMHLGVLAGAIAWLLAPLGRIRGLLVAGIAVAFTAWIGPTPSLVRAAAMTASAGIVASLGVGRPDPLASLALAALGTLSMRPDWLFDLAFQLSYLALGGILAWGLPLAERCTPPPAPALSGWRRTLHRLHAGLVTGLVIGTAAWLAGLPWVASAFGQVALAGPLLNLPAVPLASVLLPLGMLQALAGALHPLLAAPFALLTQPLGALLLAIADAGSALPSATWGVVSSFGKSAFVLATAPWAWTLRGRLAAWRAAALTSAALTTLLLLGSWGPHRIDRPTLTALDVGQGDAFLLQLPGHVNLLLDAGGTPFSSFDVGEEIVVPALRALGVHHLTWLLSSHADADHAEGLASVLEQISVGALGYGVAHPGRPTWDHLRATAAAQRVPIVQLTRGMSLEFGEATLHVLHPTRREALGDDDDPNHHSLVLQIDWLGRPWALLTGDIPSEVERTLALRPVDVLVAPHHGSAHSTSPHLLAATQPSDVIISSGTNRYGHPASVVLERIAAAGAVVHRTDRLGAVRHQPAW